MTRDESRNDELNIRLRETVPDPPLDAVDWSALHARVMARAEPLLAGEPVIRQGVWQTLSAWAGRGIPAAAAAAAAVALILGYGPDRPGASGSPAFTTVEEALANDLVGSSAPLLIAGTTEDELLDLLLFYEEGNRP